MVVTGSWFTARWLLHRKIQLSIGDDSGKLHACSILPRLQAAFLARDYSSQQLLSACVTFERGLCSFLSLVSFLSFLSLNEPLSSCL